MHVCTNHFSPTAMDRAPPCSALVLSPCFFEAWSLPLPACFATMLTRPQELEALRASHALRAEEAEVTSALLRQKEEALVQAVRDAEHAFFQRDCMQGDLDELASQVGERDATIEALNERIAELEKAATASKAQASRSPRGKPGALGAGGADGGSSRRDAAANTSPRSGGQPSPRGEAARWRAEAEAAAARATEAEGAVAQERLQRAHAMGQLVEAQALVRDVEAYRDSVIREANDLRARVKTLEAELEQARAAAATAPTLPPAPSPSPALQEAAAEAAASKAELEAVREEHAAAAAAWSREASELRGRIATLTQAHAAAETDLGKATDYGRVLLASNRELQAEVKSWKAKARALAAKAGESIDGAAAPSPAAQPASSPAPTALDASGSAAGAISESTQVLGALSGLGQHMQRLTGALERHAALLASHGVPAAAEVSLSARHPAALADAQPLPQYAVAAAPPLPPQQLYYQPSPGLPTPYYTPTSATAAQPHLGGHHGVAAARGHMHPTDGSAAQALSAFPPGTEVGTAGGHHRITGSIGGFMVAPVAAPRAQLPTQLASALQPVSTPGSYATYTPLPATAAPVASSASAQQQHAQVPHPRGAAAAAMTSGHAGPIASPPLHTSDYKSRVRELTATLALERERRLDVESEVRSLQRALSAVQGIPGQPHAGSAGSAHALPAAAPPKSRHALGNTPRPDVLLGALGGTISQQHGAVVLSTPTIAVAAGAAATAGPSSGVMGVHQPPGGTQHGGPRHARSSSAASSGGRTPGLAAHGGSTGSSAALDPLLRMVDEVDAAMHADGVEATAHDAASAQWGSFGHAQGAHGPPNATASGGSGRRAGAAAAPSGGANRGQPRTLMVASPSAAPAPSRVTPAGTPESGPASRSAATAAGSSGPGSHSANAKRAATPLHPTLAARGRA